MRHLIFLKMSQPCCYPIEEMQPYPGVQFSFLLDKAVKLNSTIHIVGDHFNLSVCLRELNFTNGDYIVVMGQFLYIFQSFHKLFVKFDIIGSAD